MPHGFSVPILYCIMTSNLSIASVCPAVCKNCVSDDLKFVFLEKHVLVSELFPLICLPLGRDLALFVLEIRRIISI